MSTKSNDNGRAYEFACITVFSKAIESYRKVKIVHNSAYEANERAWNTLDSYSQEMFLLSAKATIQSIFEAEPRMIEPGEDELLLLFQTDDAGIRGDVRDLLVIRKDIQWEIGFSIKHNHFAVKHSRLSRTNNFGLTWYGKTCSNTYFEEIRPIFNYLNEENHNGTKFDSLPNKWDDIYIPILKAFMKEVKMQYAQDNTIATKMAEYLLGHFDFYKVISVDDKRLTQIKGHNMHGTLNQPSQTAKPKIKIPISTFPSRLVSLEFIPNHMNTLEMVLDGGWSFTLRLHNASTKCEPSLKFDVQILGVPASIVTINCIWR